MKVTYNWLKDFVDITLKPQELSGKLTMAGLEVTSLEESGGDWVIEIEITSNRPDWLSVVGIAREIAALTGKKLKSYPVTRLPGSNRKTGKQANAAFGGTPPKGGGPLTIDIEDKKDCPLYTARVIRDVKVGPSPEWLKKRLELIGLRSINNVVDITNYCMFTWGEPLHAFDLDKLVGGSAGSRVSELMIGVRRAVKDEEIITIDGEKRILDESVLVITADKPIAIAGIIGGKDSEITENSRNILLEAAIFNPVVVRRARQKLGIQTDSSYRFERSVSLDAIFASSTDAVRLVSEIAGGRVTVFKSTATTKAKKKSIVLSETDVSGVLGTKITISRIKTILQNLGFDIKIASSQSLHVNVPSFRADVKSEIDLIEEITRIVGYENVPLSLPAIYPNPIDSGKRDVVALVKNTLTSLGLYEVITYSLIDRAGCAGFLSKDMRLAEISNPLSKEQEVLRPTLIPSLVKTIAYNLNQQQDEICIFEVADIFYGSQGSTCVEEPVLAIALCGKRDFLLEQGAVKDPFGVLHLKGIIERLCQRLGIVNREFYLKSGERFHIGVCLEGKEIGAMLKIEDREASRFGIKNKEIFVAQLFLEKMFPQVNLKRKFSSLPLYPGVTREISFMAKNDVKIEEIILAIKEKAKELLSEVKVVDCYKGKQIPSGYKGITVSCFYRSGERTLTDEEVNQAHSSVCQALIKAFAITIR